MTELSRVMKVAKINGQINELNIEIGEILHQINHRFEVMASHEAASELDDVIYSREEIDRLYKKLVPFVDARDKYMREKLKTIYWRDYQDAQ